ncbi:MAG: WecB/TagA/CpsF family glycosyltransferase [Patescibacteria group bacterium]
MNKTYSNNNSFKKIKILKIGFNNLNYFQVLEYLLKILEKDDRNRYFVTPNPELLVVADGDSSYEKILNSADLALPDGIGVVWASKLLGRHLKHRIAGADLMENVCRDVAKRPITVGFLGGRPGIAEKVSECLTKKYPGLKVGLTYSGAPDKETLEYIKDEIEKNNDGKKLDILFVAFGSPKQEIWISENLKSLPVKVTIGVGGAFDFISGEIKRAPVWIRRTGLEWFFRLAIQPWRIKRQLALLEFVYLVSRERFR